MTASAEPARVNKAAGRKNRPRDAARAPAMATITTGVSGQVTELAGAVKSALERLHTLIGNRSLWSDAVEGCRGAAAVLEQVSEKLKAIGDEATDLEAQVATDRAEIDRWNEMHLDLATVERSLRAELEATRVQTSALKTDSAELSKAHAKLVAGEKELRAECAQHRAARAEQTTEIDALNGRHVGDKQKITELAAQLKQSVEQRESIEETVIAPLRTELAMSKNDCSALGMARAELDGQVQALRTEMRQLRALRADLSRTQLELAAARSETEKLQEKLAALSTVEERLRMECEQHRAAREQQAVALANARSLAEKLISETSTS